MSDLATLSLIELRAGLDAGAFSAVELTAALLKRIENFKDLNCFLTVCGESALRQAGRADELMRQGQKSALLGIPVAVKDIILTKDITSTAGSRMLENFVPPYSATVTVKLEGAGAVVIGKTNMDEFAMGSSNENSAFGPVKNPWDKKRVPGGTSGGSAAAVAARLAPAALGTDTGGSIRQPASFCGVTGIKPTYGRVSRYGVVAYASSLDQVGTFGRDAADCAIVMNALSGKDPLDATSVDKPVPDFTAVLGREIKGLKIGMPKEYFAGGLNGEVEDAVKKAIAGLEDLGARVVEISLPHTEAAVATYYIIAPAEASSNLSRYDGVRYGHSAQNPADLQDLYCRSRSEGFGAEVKRRILVGTYVLSSGYYDAYYLRAQKVRTLIAQDFARVFDHECDLIACPIAPTTAFLIGEKTQDPLEMYMSDVYTLPTSLAGLPGMSIPCGLDAKGLPIGLQLIGQPWDEETLFKTAHAYQSCTDWHKRSPF